MKLFNTLLFLVLAASVAGAVDIRVPEKNERQEAQKSIDGYKTTPMHPDGKWHIHDPDRPQPPVAQPEYDGEPVPPPEGAVAILDNAGTCEFANNKWPVKDGVMTVGKGNQTSKQAFGDMHLHLEYLIPLSCRKGWGQKQGNSGVFLMGKYEIQILNCWGNRTYPDGMSGALYGCKPPLVNACRKPGEWQSCDIHFTAPVFTENELVSPAMVTVYLNGVLVQKDSEFKGATAWRKAPRYSPHPPKLPFSLQSHGNAVQYRNIWVVPKD